MVPSILPPQSPLQIPTILQIIFDSLPHKDLLLARGTCKLWHQTTFGHFKTKFPSLVLRGSYKDPNLEGLELDHEDKVPDKKHANGKVEDYLEILSHRDKLPFLFDHSFILNCEGSCEPFDQFIKTYGSNIKYLKLETENYSYRHDLTLFGSWLTQGKLPNLETLVLQGLSYFPRVNGLRDSKLQWPNLKELHVCYIGRENPSKISNLIPEFLKRCKNLEILVLSMDNYDIDELTSESDASDGISDEKIKFRSYYLQDRANYTLNRLLKATQNASKSLKHLTLTSAADVHFDTLLTLAKKHGLKLEVFGFRSFAITTSYKFNSSRIVKTPKPGSLKKFLQSQSKCLRTFKIGTESVYHGVSNSGVLQFPAKMEALKYLELEDSDDLKIQENLHFNGQFPVLEELKIRGSSEHERDWLFSENNLSDPLMSLKKLILSTEFTSSGSQAQNIFVVFPNLENLECEFPKNEFLNQLWRQNTTLKELKLQIHGLAPHEINSDIGNAPLQNSDCYGFDNLSGLRLLRLEVTVPHSIPTSETSGAPEFYKLLLNKVRENASKIQQTNTNLDLTQGQIQKYLKTVEPNLTFQIHFVQT